MSDDEKPAISEAPRTPLFLDLVLLLVPTALAFSFGLSSELLWDDEHLLRSATSLRSPLDAFGWHSLGLGEGPRIAFWRPLTTLSYFLEARLFGTNPLVFRATNLLLHLGSTALVLRLAERFFLDLSKDHGTGRLLGFSVALLWAIVPLKAEAVCWISGRADLLGAFLVLLGAELTSRAKTDFGKLSTIALFAAAAPLAKEAYVTAPLFLLLETKRPLGTLIRSKAAYLTLVPSGLYVILRLLGPGLGGGGAHLLVELPLFDRVALFVETIGVAAATLAVPFVSIFFRAPLGFFGFGEGTESFSLQTLPLYGLIGLTSLLAAFVLAFRVSSLRSPLLEVAVLLLPVANLVPTGIEARFCDRYAYLALLPFLLGVTRAFLDLSRRRVELVAFGAATLALLGLPLGAIRAYDFAHPERLFSRELPHEPPHSIYREAAFVFMEHERIDAARDALIGAVKRREALGLPFLLRDALLAARLEQDLSGEQWPEGRADFAKLTSCLLERNPGGARFPLADPFFAFKLPCADPALESAVHENRELLEAMRLVLLARAGHPVESAIERAFRECPECTLANADLAQAALALGKPNLALAILGKEKRGRFERLREVARYELSLDRKPASDGAKAAQLFIGAAYRPACLLLRTHSLEEIPQALADAACTLGGVEANPRFALTTLEARRLRTSPLARVEFARTALSLH